jgi:hypothetical protein
MTRSLGYVMTSVLALTEGGMTSPAAAPQPAAVSSFGPSA